MVSLDLRRVMYVLVTLVLATNGFAVLATWLFFRQLRSPVISFSPSSVPGGVYYAVIPSLFVFVELLVVIWICRPISLPSAQSSEQGGQTVLAGFCSGLALFIVCIPLLLRMRPDTGLVSLIVYHETNLITYLSVSLILMALPVSAEIVFKIVVLRTLLKELPLVWSLLITSVAFAITWPVFPGYWLALGLGVVTCLLYNRYRSLLPSVVAHVTFVAVVFGCLALRVLLHR